MGFKQAKAQLLDCLGEGNVQHDARNDIDVKNLLAVGEVSLDDVAAVVGQSRGSDYQSMPHHQIAGVEVHVISTQCAGVSWYLKWYFVEPNSVFISVHH